MPIATLWQRYALHVWLTVLILGWMLVVAAAVAADVAGAMLGGLSLGIASMQVVREVRRS